MDYHSDRFEDCSLMIYKDESLFAILPANFRNKEVFSHQGLSYGGLILKLDSKFEVVLEAFKSALQYYNERGFENLTLKLLPKIYHQLPSDEIDYLMFITKAEVVRRDIASIIDLSDNKLPKSSNRKRNLKKAKTSHIEVKEVSDFDAFFNQILIPNLKERHKALPTHTVEELAMLKSKFDENIRQFNAYYENEIIAGVTVFDTKNVAHAQYISTIESSKDLGGLDAIFDRLMSHEFANKAYFSFGISNENQGQNINQGLLKWKESFGARTIIHDFYRIQTKNYNLLNNVFI